MGKQKYKVCARSYWSKKLTFPNTSLRISLVAQPLTNQSNQIHFNNGCPSCQSRLKRVDYCPECSATLKAKVEGEFGKEKVDELIANGFLGKTIASGETIKLHTIGEKTIVFTKAELETIKTATEDLIAIGYGKMETINPQHIDNCYALLPNLNDVADDGDYRRLLYALKQSNMYVVVQYSDRGNTKNGVLIAYKDSVTDREFLMLVNTKDSKDLTTAIEYQPPQLTNEEEVKQVVQFLQTALPQKDFKDITENEIEKKKQMLIAMKMSGQEIKVIEHKEEIKPNVNGFAMAQAQIETTEQKKIEG